MKPLKKVNELKENECIPVKTDAEVEKQALAPITHETCVIGFNTVGQIVFMKTYHYSTEKVMAQSDVSWVKENCHRWQIGALKELEITTNGLYHNIIIPIPNL